MHIDHRWTPAVVANVMLQTKMTRTRPFFDDGQDPTTGFDHAEDDDSHHDVDQGELDVLPAMIDQRDDEHRNRWTAFFSSLFKLQKW